MNSPEKRRFKKKKVAFKDVSRVWATANNALWFLEFYRFQFCTEMCREPTYTPHGQHNNNNNASSTPQLQDQYTGVEHTRGFTQRIGQREATQGWGGGCQYWVCSGDVGSGVSVELLHTTVHAGLKSLLTDWCLVTMMVGMGELSAWPLSEPRIWIQEDRKAQGQASLLSPVLSKLKSLMQWGFS